MSSVTSMCTFADPADLPRAYAAPTVAANFEAKAEASGRGFEVRDTHIQNDVIKRYYG